MSTSNSLSLDNLFNPDFYRASNPDLASLNNQQALEHWKIFGIAEERQFSPLIDINFYRASNPDLIALENRQLFEHLANFGLNEGRSFSPFVDLRFYQASNPDLEKLNNYQLLEHLSNLGFNEGRVFSPFVDLNFYRSSNPDLGSLNHRQLFDHLFQSGLNEGRTFSPFFDLNVYRASNPDLAALNNRPLWEHFHTYGLSEGRRYSPFSFNSNSGYGLVNAAAAVANATGQSNFVEVPNLGGNNWGLDLIKAPEVWNQGYTGQGIVVAVVDSGVDYYHPDLDNNIWVNSDEIPDNGIDDDGNGYVDDVRGWDFVYDDNAPIDLYGHGTHVAGIIAAENNGIGVTGVAHNAKIMPVRVLGLFGTGYDDDIAAGIRYAADNGADVINLSLSGLSPYPKSALAIKYAIEKGVVVVSAAGNNYGFEPGYPGSYATHFGITVGAVDRYNSIPAFSDYAGTTPLDYVVAPGANIYSTSAFGGYELMDGTSMAAPHVSGVAALMLSANPNLSPVVVERILTTTANSANVRSFSASSIDGITGNPISSGGDDFNSQLQAQAQAISGDINQPAMQMAMFGSSPDGFYDLTFGNDNFLLTPGLLASSPLGLRALDGNDTVQGSLDNEVIFGNLGDDLLYGSGGNDSVWGGQGTDFVHGDDGNDILNGNMGFDLVFGEAGDDYIRGGKDTDVLSGDEGNDTLIGDLGKDVLVGGAGSDLLVLRTDTVLSELNTFDFILDFDKFSDRIGLNGGFTPSNLVLIQENLPLNPDGLIPGFTREVFIQGGGVDIDPNGDGIISGTTIALGGGTVLGFAVNVTPADLSGRFVQAFM